MGSSKVEHPGTQEGEGSVPSPRVCRGGVNGSTPSLMNSEEKGQYLPAANHKLYVIGRCDLLPGLRAAQMVHVLRLYAAQYPFIESRWYTESNTIVLLEACESDLKALVERGRDRGVTMSVFSEPDVVDGLTAVAIGPDGWRLVSSFPLAFKV